MSPPESSSSDEVNKLPAVPRVRRSSGAKPPVPRPNRSASKSKREAQVAEKRPVRQSTRRRVAKRSLPDDSANSEDDANESYVPVRRTSRRSQKTRKVIEDDDDFDEDEDDDEATPDNDNKDELYIKDDNEVSADMLEEDEDDELDMEDDDDASKSASVSVSRSKKRRKTIRESSSDSREIDQGDENGNGDENDDSNDYTNDYTNDSGDGEGSELIKGQKDILAQLEAEVNKDDSEDFKSESSEEPKPKRSRRLTSRQRALQGENVKLEYSKLDSPKAKKKEVQEDWDHDEEMELKRQQKARLRQMVSEKRNREKRAAMVDKVLRGVTSKRKKLTLATEARAAQVEVRLTQNEMREGCMRYVSNKEGSTLSIPKDADVPPYLCKSLKAVYPPMCKRDPKTGKRIFSSVLAPSPTL
eukprot:TRINITY_DN1283_c0_g1_i1.p2 TRINITY_DN1283_c0_g1~~TRINITY_DN1283_c0_g1_i1.p2  ORF type:complete len:415 (-),score=96.77 TRINITY_DN1283_c0_g1_i1:3540-4784(-)